MNFYIDKIEFLREDKKLGTTVAVSFKKNGKEIIFTYFTYKASTPKMIIEVLQETLSELEHNENINNLSS